MTLREDPQWIEFDGNRPPHGWRFEHGAYQVRVIMDVWQEAQGHPRGAGFNPKARYRRMIPSVN